MYLAMRSCSKLPSSLPNRDLSNFTLGTKNLRFSTRYLRGQSIYICNLLGEISSKGGGREILSLTKSNRVVDFRGGTSFTICKSKSEKISFHTRLVCKISFSIKTMLSPQVRMSRTFSFSMRNCNSLLFKGPILANLG